MGDVLYCAVQQGDSHCVESAKSAPCNMIIACDTKLWKLVDITIISKDSLSSKSLIFFIYYCYLFMLTVLQSFIPKSHLCVVTYTVIIIEVVLGTGLAKPFIILLSSKCTLVIYNTK